MSINRLEKYIIHLSFALLFILTSITPIFAQAESNPSGLEVPRYSSTRAKPINVRVGPGKRYDVAWIYIKSGVPVEVIAEFDVWRKVRDFEGSEGWIHQSLISSARVAKIKADIENPVPLLAKPNGKSIVKAWLNANYQLSLKSCDGKWCEARIKFSSNDKKQKILNGYIEQSALWGVYENEKFD